MFAFFTAITGSATANAFAFFGDAAAIAVNITAGIIQF